MAKYIQPLTGLAQTKAKAGTLPQPSGASDGVSLATFSPRSGAGYPKCVLSITADGAATLTNAVIWVLEPNTGVWGPWMSINPATSSLPASISLSATQGFHIEIDLPTVWSRIAIVGTVSADNVGYSIYPISEMY